VHVSFDQHINFILCELCCVVTEGVRTLVLGGLAVVGWKVSIWRISDCLSAIMHSSEHNLVSSDNYILVDRSMAFLHSSRLLSRNGLLNPSSQVQNIRPSQGWKYRIFGTWKRVMLLESAFLLCIVCITTMEYVWGRSWIWNELWVLNRRGGSYFACNDEGAGGCKGWSPLEISPLLWKDELLLIRRPLVGSTWILFNVATLLLKLIRY
jgi:hypothetical protein